MGIGEFDRDSGQDLNVTTFVKDRFSVHEETSLKDAFVWLSDGGRGDSQTRVVLSFCIFHTVILNLFIFGNFVIRHGQIFVSEQEVNTEATVL